MLRGRVLAGVEERYDRISTLSVVRGLHILRYASLPSGGIPPIAVVRVASASGSAGEIISTPGLPRGQLTRPGECLVIRAERPIDVSISLRRGAVGGSLDATFRLEGISLSESPAAPGSMEPANVKEGLFLLAHLANRGDVEVAEDQWVGGPSSPAPIEGLEMRGSDAEGVSLEMQVLAASRPPRWSSWVGKNEFAGTRGRRMPLTGVRIRMRSGDGEGKEIAAEALFLGSLIVSRRGREVELVSTSGVDPMVGLKMGVQAVEKAPTVRNFDGAGRDRESRVRVFRASVSA